MAIQVQRGKQTLIARTRTITPTNYQSKESMFIIVETGSSDTGTQGPERWMIRAVVLENGDIRFEKPTANATGTMSYHIVTCTEGEFRVVHIDGEMNTVTSSANVRFLKNPVDPERSFVVGSQRPGGSPGASNANDFYVTYHLAMPNVVQVARAGTGGGIACQFSMCVVEFACWTGIKCYQGEDTLAASDHSSKVAYAHGVDLSTADAENTWLQCSFRHDSNGLEQCTLQASMLDGSSVLSEDNIYYQRRTTTTGYISHIAWNLIVMPDNLDNSDDFSVNRYTGTSGTGTTYTQSPTAGPACTIIVKTNSCSGTGTAFARNHWTIDLIAMGGDDLISVQYIRGYSGQTAEFDVQFVKLCQLDLCNPCCCGPNF